MILSTHTKYILSYFSELIKLARKEKYMSREDLAERVGVSLTKIIDMENGDHTIDIGTYIETCFILGIPLLDTDEKHVKNLSTMLSYMNTFIPKIQKEKEIDDDF